jgi:hypothetical protein
MENSKVCLSTYIYGDKYQDYIPLLVYSIHKAYPDYYVILFLHGKLREDIDRQLSDCDLYGNLEIKENVFTDCPKMSPLKSKMLRWILWDNVFLQFDYLYIVDIDMLYIGEPIPLHIQHLQHIETTELPFDNMRRIYKKPSFAFSVMRRLKYAGLKGFVRFLVNYRHPEYRLSGLHFIDVKKYYSVYTEQKRMYWQQQIYSDNYLKHINSPKDEILSYKINKRLGFDVDKLAIQSNETASLDFNNTQRAEFRPHHGIHLGIFRTENALLSESERKILDSPAYQYYIDIFKENMLYDEKFILLSHTFNANLKTYFERMYQYYTIAK